MSKKGELASEQDIQHIIRNALYQDKALFVLSAHSRDQQNAVLERLSKAWQDAQRAGKQAHIKDLSIVSLTFPWAEHPAHALFTSAIELWNPLELEGMLQRALSVQDRFKVTENTHIATVLEGMANPFTLGSEEFLSKYSFGRRSEAIKPLLRTYILDSTSQPSDRHKLGLARALTTQDRYELLQCIWLCQQGLARDLDLQKHTRLWVSINEAENVLDYAPQERKVLAKGLASLISKTAHFLTIWLNVTERDAVTAHKVKQALGDLVFQWLDFDFTNEVDTNEQKGRPAES